MNEIQPTEHNRGRFLVFLLLLGGTLAVLCHDGFRHNYTFWSNDGPLGFMSCESARFPAVFLGHWSSESWIGGQWPAASPNIDAWLGCLVSPQIFLKIFTPVSMLILGFSFWLLFRQLNFGAPVCILGGLAAGLNMHFFSVACWGLGTWCLAAGMTALALAALVSPNIKQFWAKGVLAGLAVGMGVMEGFDVGAILSVYVGVFVIFYFWVTETNKGTALARMISTEVLVVLFSGLIAASTIWGLYGTQLVGISSTSGGTPEAEAQRWDFTTQWSTPKIETFGVFVSGLFGYRMQEYMTDQDKSSAYWGLQGETPLVEELESSDPKVRAAAGLQVGGPQASMVAQVMESNDLDKRHYIVAQVKKGVQLRHTGSGEYAGIAVALLALLGLANSFRGEKSLLSIVERKMIWFFGAAAAISLLSAWGRNSFLFGAFWYRLPLISNIRNPMKFMHPFDILLIILAGFGMEALHRRYAAGIVGQAASARQRWSDSWKNSGVFEKAWFFGSILFVACGVTAFIFYQRAEPKLIAYLQDNGFTADLAPGIAAYSIKSAFWGLFFLASTVVVSLLLLVGAWSREKVVIAWGLLAAILIVDLSRSDMPWIRYFDVGKKYSANLIVDILKDKPYEHRVVGRTSPMGPYDLSTDASNLAGLCHWWMENDYPYNKIQNLEIDQEPRMPDMDGQYLGRFGTGGNNLQGGARLWRLTNTKYIICDANVVPILNGYADPVNHSFHAIGLYHMVPKPWIPQINLPDGRIMPQVEDAGDLTLWPVDQNSSEPPISTNVFALVQYDSALPRAKLYANWVMLDDAKALDTVASPAFDIGQSVVVSKSTPVEQAPGSTAADPGTVNITDYHATDIKLEANAKTPAVMLFNERYLAPDDNVGQWKVFVDQNPVTLLRCNYIMRGVFLTPGHHTIEFRYRAHLRYLYVTLLAFLAGFLVAGYVIYSHKTQPPAPPPAEREPEREPKPERAR